MNSMVSFVLFCILLNGFASAQTLIQDSCKKAQANVPEFDYNFCVKSLTEDPQSKAATSLEGLVLASTKKAQVELMNLKGIVEQILKDKKGQGIEVELHDCVVFYDSGNDYLNNALANVKSHEYGYAQPDFSVALEEPTKCEAEIYEKGVQSPITNENNRLTKRILIPSSFNLMLI